VNDEASPQMMAPSSPDALPADGSSAVALQPAREVLQKYWGYQEFRPLQEQAIQAVLEHRDSLLVLPTGGGKSLCYQVPGLLREGLTVVVSPLIALMKDQVDALRDLGIAAAAVNSSQSAAEQRQIADEIQSGRIKLLYVAPERLCTERMLNFLAQQQVASIAVDEAHCISSWGHHFRPEYRLLGKLRERLPQVDLHAFTATATEQVRHDIAQQLGLRNPQILVGNFDRPNLTYRVIRRSEIRQQIRAVLERHPGQSGIIYCISRKQVEEMEAHLRQTGFLPWRIMRGWITKSASRRRTISSTRPRR
jgi:ATP-dependent DNA helicase RecQ